MENVRECRLKENIKYKLYSDVEMHKKMFYLMLNRSIDEAERERKNGELKDFNEVILELNKEFGFKLETI